MYIIVFILMKKRALVALLTMSSWCLVMAEWLFLAVPWVCLPFVIVVFLDRTHLLFISISEFIKLVGKRDKLLCLLGKARIRYLFI